MKQLSRRSALLLAAMSPAIAKSDRSVTPVSDAVLLDLGDRFDAISARLDQDPTTDWSALIELDRVLTHIAGTAATTLDGLYVKARVGCWTLLGDFDSADRSAAGAPMAFSIMRDLIRLHAPHLEDPGALQRLLREIENGGGYQTPHVRFGS
jgi:hypothetical protein